MKLVAIDDLWRRLVFAAAVIVSGLFSISISVCLTYYVISMRYAYEQKSKIWSSGEGGVG